MVTIELETVVDAPPERVFDLSRSIDLHRASAGHTGEEAVAGCTAGLIGPGESVTWCARHFGVRQRLTTEISGYDRPRWFQDRMVRGAFAWFIHDHHFDALPGGGTRMRDVFRFAAPLGPLGWVAERLVLRRYMTRFLRHRNDGIRRAAGSGAWREYLPADGG